MQWESNGELSVLHVMGTGWAMDRFQYVCMYVEGCSQSIVLGVVKTSGMGTSVCHAMYTTLQIC